MHDVLLMQAVHPSGHRFAKTSDSCRIERLSGFSHLV